MIWYLPIAKESLAGQPQGRTMPALPGAEPLSLQSDIVARHRHDALPFRELQLKTIMACSRKANQSMGPPQARAAAAVTQSAGIRELTAW